MWLIFLMMFVGNSDVIETETAVPNVAETNNSETTETIPFNITTTEDGTVNVTHSNHNISEDENNKPHHIEEDDFHYNNKIAPIVVLDSEAGINIPHHPDEEYVNHRNPWLHKKFFPVTLLQKISHNKFLRPLSNKLSDISSIFSYPFHPNFGGIQLLSPQHIWEKFHEKANHFIGGSHSAIFGSANRGQLDYPFAYRKARDLNYLQEKLDNYKEHRQPPFLYEFGYISFKKDNDSYEFPYLPKNYANSNQNIKSTDVKENE